MNSKEVLEKLSRENSILRMGNVEGDLTVDEAIKFIRKYGRVIRESSFPRSMYWMLN